MKDVQHLTKQQRKEREEILAKIHLEKMYEAFEKGLTPKEFCFKEEMLPITKPMLIAELHRIWLQKHLEEQSTDNV